MPYARTPFRCSDLAASAVWSMLGAALVIHGCAQTPPSVRRDPAASRAPAVVARTPAPAPAPASVAPAPAPAAAPAPRRPVFSERPFVPSEEPELRVRIAALRRADPVVRLSHPGGSLRMLGAGLPARPVATPVDVRPTDAGWRVTEGAGTRGARTVDVSLKGPIEFAPPSGARQVTVYDGTSWPGPVRIVPTADAPAALDLVVDVPLERYLPGVLAKELIKSWDPEAFRAQAIAARSFAVCEQAHWKGRRHYDLVAGEASQAWVGEVKDAKPREAVAATRGMVLAFEGRVVPAYYSSTCGGTPANAVESLTHNPHHGIAPLAAGLDGPPAVRTCCDDAPRWRWEQSFTNAELCERLRRWARARLDLDRPAAPGAPPPPPPSDGELALDAPLEALAGISRIESIEVTASNPAGRPNRVRLADASGRTLELRAEDFRRAVNFAPEGSPTPKHRLHSSHLAKARVVADRVEFAGRGFGHGVGMCQYGAQDMARGGARAERILATYYPGSAIVRAW